MKVEGYLFLGCAVFFGGSDLVYWHYSHDPTGTTALALSVALAFLTGFYVLFTGRIGFFSPHSWWPLFMGLSAATAALGMAVGWWMFLIGLLFVIFSAIGFVFEYYRGHYAH